MWWNTHITVTCFLDYFMWTLLIISTCSFLHKYIVDTVEKKFRWYRNYIFCGFWVKDVQKLLPDRIFLFSNWNSQFKQKQSIEQAFQLHLFKVLHFCSKSNYTLQFLHLLGLKETEFILQH